MGYSSRRGRTGYVDLQEYVLRNKSTIVHHNKLYFIGVHLLFCYIV